MDFLTHDLSLSPLHRRAIGHVLRMKASDVVAPGKSGWSCLPMRGRRLDPRQHHPLGLHRDQWPEICIAIDGEAVLDLAGQRYAMCGPRVGIIPPGVWHSEGFSRVGRAYHLLWLMISRQSTLGLIIHYQGRRRWDCIARHSVRAPAARLLFESITDIDHIPGPGEFEFLRVQLLAILGQLAWEGTQATAASDHDPPQGGARQPHHRAVLEHLQDQLDHHFEKPYDLEQLAQRTRLTARYIARLFKAKTGVSVHHYHIQRRMAHAKVLCDQSNLLIKEIALRVGYDDPCYFSRAFKQFHGYWPSRGRGVRD